LHSAAFGYQNQFRSVRSMSAHYSLDRESFQEFLANAFAVQECGLDVESLNALVEMQQFVMSGELDVDRAMGMIVERALKASTASGIAIALLEFNELVYRAGSGTAVNYIGRHVPAVLSVSPGGELRREILRVENVQADSRIQAEICRQFECKALLMLPIYKSHILVGVLHVLFSEAHAFHDPEVRMYRMILGLVEEMLVTHIQQEQKRPVGGYPRTTSSHGPASQCIQVVDSAKISAISGAVAEQNLWATPTLTSSHDPHILVFRTLWIRLTALIHKEVSRPRTQTFWRIGAVVTTAIVLGTNTWVAFSDHSARSVLLRNVSTRYDAGQHTPAEPSAITRDAVLAGPRTKETTRLSTGFKRVRIGPEEVDYIANDVTIRHFTTRCAGEMTRMRERHVNLGDDVTVRYFSCPTITTTQRHTTSVPTLH
jgi:hypothetical protein